METIKYSGGLVKRYSSGEHFSLDGADYVIQQIESNDAQRMEELRRQGFCFHDRFLFVEIHLKKTRKMRQQKSVGMEGLSMEISREYPADLYELAYASFETDRRFHLDQQFDQRRAKEVKKAYIDRCKERGMIVYSIRRAGELLGCIIADPHPGTGGGYFQIMLGVTRDDMKGKMAALPLYNGLLDAMAQPENGGFATYCGYVSAANAASVNMHFYLGAKITRVVDEYIYRIGEKMDENSLTEHLLDEILHRIPGQAFSVRKTVKKWTDEERQRFEQELSYLTETYSMEDIVEGYSFYANSVMEETKYFQKYGDYRCHSFAEVDAYIYNDPERMKQYMLGLAVAEFLWMTVLEIHRFYEKLIRSVSGRRYLEIGPGHGKYFLEAYNLQLFQQYDAVDVSETAIAMTRNYMERYMLQNGVGGGTNYHLFCQDAAKLSNDMSYDFIVIQEVLEHIEDPLDMLLAIRRMLSPSGMAYALFPINAPSPAHIYLFRSIAHVKETVSEAGFAIMQEAYITANNVPAAQAEEKKLPINACLVLKPKTTKV